MYIYMLSLAINLMINTISIEGVKALPLFMESSRHLQQMKFKQAQNGFKLLLDRLNTDNYGLPSYTYVLRRYIIYIYIYIIGMQWPN